MLTLEWNAPFFGSIEFWWYILICKCQIFQKVPAHYFFYPSSMLTPKVKSTSRYFFHKSGTYKSNLYWSKFGAFYKNDEVSNHTLTLAFWRAKVLKKKKVLFPEIWRIQFKLYPQTSIVPKYDEFYSYYEVSDHTLSLIL